MNKKILVGIAVAIIAVAIVIIGAKAMLGDEKTELPLEEKAEKILNLEEKSAESGESEEQESEDDEAAERLP